MLTSAQSHEYDCRPQGGGTIATPDMFGGTTARPGVFISPNRPNPTRPGPIVYSNTLLISCMPPTEHQYLQSPTVPKAQRNVTKTFSYYVCSANAKISLTILMIFASLNSAGSAATIVLRTPTVPTSKEFVCSLAAYNYPVAGTAEYVRRRCVTLNYLAYHVP